MKRACLAEFLGSAFLLIGVVGSGIMAADLAGENVALALLANAIATGAMLFCIITCLAPISGAHFNPVVSLLFYFVGDLSWQKLLAFVPCQIIGAIMGVYLSHLMFDLPIFQFSKMPRAGLGLWSSEAIATFGLLFVIVGGLFSRPTAIPALVAVYITGAYWFTSSTSFANPAVTIARALSDTFAGINPSDVPMFIIFQMVGLGLAVIILPILFPRD